MESMGTFTKNTAFTLIARVLNLILGMATSIIVARLLGPEGKGIYSLVILLPSFITAFTSLGIGPATVYYVARKQYPFQEIFGNNIFLSLLIGAGSVTIGLIVVLFFQGVAFPDVPQHYLLIALALIPLTLFVGYIQNIFLGMQRVRDFNVVSLVQAALTLIFVSIALWGIRDGIVGAIIANIVASLLVSVGLFFRTKKVAGGVSFSSNPSYLKKISTYGIKAHLSNVLAFLNYRLDILLVSGFLSPLAVGYYSVAVGIAEKLWMVSQAASTVLFPKIAAEEDERARKEFTPIVSRTVLWLATLGAMTIFLLSRWIVVLLYSVDYLPAVRPLQILLPGIVALSVGRVLANDVTGRGRPMLNAYINLLVVATNVVLNLLWLPRYGIEGAAGASTVSYIILMVGEILIYSRLSGNPPLRTLLLQRADWTLYRRLGARAVEWNKHRSTAEEEQVMETSSFGRD